LSQRKILVIGGGGFIGRRIVLELLEGGCDVTVFTRRRKESSMASKIEIITGDRSDWAGFHGLLGGRSFDAVIDLIAYGREDVESCLRTFSKTSEHYLLCSTGAVYRDYQGWERFHPIKEDEVDLAWKGDGAYSEGKREAELVLWSLKNADRPFPFTIVRPSVVEGPGDRSGRTWFWVQRIADGGPVLVPRTVPSTIFNHAYVDDVAETFAKSIGNPAAFNQAFNVAGREILALEDYVRSIAEAAGLESRTVSAPAELIGRQEGLTDFRGPFVGERFVMSVDKVRRELGCELTPLTEWLKETVRWFLDEYRGPDSSGYEKRALEVEAAETLAEP